MTKSRSEEWVTGGPPHLSCTFAADWHLQGFCKEVVMWSALRHPNVLPLLGATTTGTRYAMVSKWMTDGNINAFVEAHPDADRFDLVGSPF